MGSAISRNCIFRIENAFLSAYYSELGERVWIGLEKVVTEDNSIEFRWMDGSDFTFDSWGQFEPSELTDI